MIVQFRIPLFTFLALWVLFSLSSCRKDESIFPDNPPISKKPVDSLPLSDSIAYDILLVIGQSNTHSGLGIDPLIDITDSLIFQLGRVDTDDGKIIPAVEPLQHYTRNLQKIGFALPFAKLYKSEFLKKGRKVLIIPCGMGDTGFRKQRWNKGNDLYEDAVERSNKILKQHPKSQIVTILWHQGEADLNNSTYQASLDAMITNIRTDIKSTIGQKLPFVVGGLVPYWTDQHSSRIDLEAIIKNTPTRVVFTGYADPRNPFVIQKVDNDFDVTHYDAAGQREFAKRYFTAFTKLHTVLASANVLALN